MNKINGYTQEEAQTLVGYISEGKDAGKTLSFLFESYGKSHGRAKGSVRNYYYTLLRSRSDARVDKMLKDTRLKAETIREFTEEETDEMIKNILTERGKGYSVRRSIKNIAGDDDKLTLRMQNKFRNVLKKEPERVERIGKELGVALPSGGEDRRLLLKNRIENEIERVYEKINEGLKRENDRLQKENSELKKRLQLREETYEKQKTGE